MTTISKLYPILRKTGLDDSDVQEFIEIKEDLKNAEIRLNEKLHATEIRLIKWVVGSMLAQTGIIVAVVKLLL